MSWLGYELSPDVQRRRVALEKEECRTLSMLRPRTAEETYRWFGTFLGLLPPLALFGRVLWNSNLNSETQAWWVLFCVLMNLVCCLVGRRFGAILGGWAGDPRARTRTGFAFVIFVMAVAWSAVTGGLGGAVCFGIGAIFGILCAAPVALMAFPVFAILHRLLSHGGMIEARHLWPLACGIPLTIAALILSPWLR